MKLCFPENVLTQHLVVLGKTGAGKSSALLLVLLLCTWRAYRIERTLLVQSRDSLEAQLKVVRFDNYVTQQERSEWQKQARECRHQRLLLVEQLAEAKRKTAER